MNSNLNFIFSTLKLMFTNDKTTANIERNREIITRLKFISTFQAGEKINTSLLHIESNSFFTPIKRKLNGESRQSTIKFITETIERSFEIIQALSFSEHISEQMICRNIINDMIQAIHGLHNIQKTYREDKIFCCTIDTLIDNINAKCMEIKLKKPDLFPSDNNEVISNNDIQSTPQITSTTNSIFNSKQQNSKDKRDDKKEIKN
jgi:hypothetical protein